nr:MAG TPA: hypothetical protein [Caudoviricetes sp.]
MQSYSVRHTIKTVRSSLRAFVVHKTCAFLYSNKSDFILFVK